MHVIRNHRKEGWMAVRYWQTTILKKEWFFAFKQKKVVWETY